MFELEVLQAKHGDALLLHYGKKSDPKVIVIDSGPPGVYAKAMRPALTKLKAANGGTLGIRMLMVSHLDDDHIGGVTRLLRELSDQIDNQQPQSWTIQTIWNNTFADLVKHQPKIGEADVAAVGASIDSALPHGLQWADAVIASVPQGREVRDLTPKISTLNVPFTGLVQSRKKAISMGDGLSFTVVGPATAQLKALQKEWNEQIAKLKKGGKLTASAAEKLDESAYNLSSIVVLAKCEGKTMLLTGDARGDYVLESLEAVGLLKKNKTMHVDVLKVPHHGSSRNTPPEFFERILADHYVFSGDGKHDNPEPECVRRLVAARGNHAYTMHFTYAPADLVASYPAAKMAKLQKLLKPAGGKKFTVVTGSAGGSLRIAL